MRNKKMVIKSNELNEARYKLTTLEQKIILSVVAKIQPDDIDFKIYRLYVTDLIALLDIHGNNLYRDIKRITKGLRKKEIAILETESNSELVTGWFSSVRYFHGKGYIEFRFDPGLKPYLLQLKERFVSYHLKNIIQLKSSYSIRLYELLKQYEKIGYREFELENLKKILGIAENEYELYSHFKSRVLFPAQQEIPEKTDLNFSFDEIKEGRSVAHIKFNIYKKAISKKENLLKDDQESDIDLNEESQLNTLINLLPEGEREKKTIINVLIKYINQHDLEYVIRNIRYTNKHCNSNYRLFLSKALKEDWGLQLQEDEKAKEKIILAQKEKRKSEAEKRTEEEAIKRQIEDYIKTNKEKLREEAMKRLDKDLYHGLEKDDPISRFALTGLIQQIAFEKLSLQA